MIEEVLRKSRIKEGIGQQDLAREIGISPFVLNRVERGRQGFKEEWIDLLPEALRREVVGAYVEHHAREIERFSGKLVELDA